MAPKRTSAAASVRPRGAPPVPVFSSAFLLSPTRADARLTGGPRRGGRERARGRGHRVNCSFYVKIGACRHGDRCSRQHNRPAFSQTILLANLSQNPTHITGNTLTEEQLQLHFEQFYEDMFSELSINYGEVEELYVCDNIGEHLIGNVYARFRYEEDASKAVESLNNRFYAGAPLPALPSRCHRTPLSLR